jgi:hypothetical protein
LLPIGPATTGAHKIERKLNWSPSETFESGPRKTIE